MEKESKEKLDYLANLTGCVVGAITAAEQLNGPQKAKVLAKGQEAMDILLEQGYLFSQKEVDYNIPDLPTYLLTNKESKEVIFRMKCIHTPAKAWYDHFTI